MTAPEKPVADEARLLDLLIMGDLAAFGKETGLSIHDLGRMMHGEDDPEDDFDHDDDDYFDDDDEDWWLRPEWLRPEWLHPDCLNACLALELGTCCRYPDNPLVRAAVDLAGMVEQALARLGRDDCPAAAVELARLFRFIPGLLAQVHAILPRLNATAVAQFRCPVGRLAGAVDLVCADGCPWACGDPAVPDRRAEFEPIRPLLAECATALRTALGQGRAGLETSAWVGDSRCPRWRAVDHRNLSTNIIENIANCPPGPTSEGERGTARLPSGRSYEGGTTALHTALSRHPGLYMSPIKEPKFFLTDGPPPASGGPEDALTYREHVWQRDRYEALFDPAPPGTLRSESTPLYLYDRPALLERVLGEDFGDWLAPRTRSGGLVGARPAGQPGPGQERPPRVIAAPLVAAIPALAIFPVYTLVSRATLTEHGTDHESTSADGGQHVPSALGAKGQTGGNARRLCRGSVRGCSGGLYGARRREQRAGPGASGFRLSAPDCQPDAADRGSVLRDRSPVLHSEGDAELL